MTRGIIVYIDINGEYCVSTEFNGDMHSYSHGLEIIDKYKNRKLVTKSDYVKFISAFDRKHFRYGYEGDELVHYGKIEDDRLDLTRLYPDYFYIINHSGNKISFTCRSNTFELDDQAMTITHFETVDRVVKMDPSNNPMITKQRCEILDCAYSANSDGLSVADMADDTQLSLEELMILKEESRILHDKISKLTLQEQFIIKSIYFEGMKQKEVAEILGVTKGALSQRLGTILRKMRTMYLEG